MNNIITYNANIYTKAGIMQNIVLIFNIILTIVDSEIFNTFNQNK